MRKRLVNFFISFLFIVSLIFIFYQMWKVSNVDAIENQRLVGGITSSESIVLFPSESEVQEINDAYFFGKYMENENAAIKSKGFSVGAQEISEYVINNAPKTLLIGSITGLLLSGNDKKNLVIIERSGKQNSYSVGERIAGSNVVILRILEDKILLNENGYYALMFFNE